MRGRPPLVALTLLLVVTPVAGCSRARTVAAADPSVAPATMRVLAPSAVPGVSSVVKVLTVRELAQDASIPGLASDIKSWGYLDGRERTFQGESRHLTFVASRALVFRDDSGAGRFVAFVRAHSAAFFGSAVGTRPLTSRGRSGWLFTPAPCACHMANPIVVGVLRAGSHVVWLEINGPDARRVLLTHLLDPAESAPATLPG